MTWPTSTVAKLSPNVFCLSSTFSFSSTFFSSSFSLNSVCKWVRLYPAYNPKWPVHFIYWNYDFKQKGVFLHCLFACLSSVCLSDCLSVSLSVTWIRKRQSSSILRFSILSLFDVVRLHCYTLSNSGENAQAKRNHGKQDYRSRGAPESVSSHEELASTPASVIYTCAKVKMPTTVDKTLS